MTLLTTSPRGIGLIKQFEGFRAQAYQDVVGVWTIGYGFTEGVTEGQHMTRAQADARLATELLRYEAAVLAACKVEPNQNQFDALVSLAWNIGPDRMAKSSVIKAHNRGDTQAAARAFGLWNKAGGKEWPGLVRRRAAEAAIYLEPMIGALPQTMPQAVDAPREPTRSRTIAGQVAVTAGTAAASAVEVLMKDLQTAQTTLQPLVEMAPVLKWAFVAVVLAGVALTVWARVDDWRNGRR